MDLPYELRILPPQAIDVLRFMGARPDGQADADAICEGAGLTDRAFGKAIRRLVTRNYLSMDDAGYYHLTPEGRRAVAAVTQVYGDAPPAPAPQAAPAVTRRLTVVLPKSLGVQQPAAVYIGIDAPPDSAPRLGEAASLTLRVEAINAEITPDEYTLDVPPDRAARPATFTLTAPAAGTARVRVRTCQMAGFDMTDVGGLYVDVSAVPPEVADPALQALSVDLKLQPT